MKYTPQKIALIWFAYLHLIPVYGMNFDLNQQHRRTQSVPPNIQKNVRRPRKINFHLNQHRPRAQSVPNITIHGSRPSRLSDIDENIFDRDFIPPTPADRQNNNHDQLPEPHHMVIPHYPGFRPIITYQPMSHGQQDEHHPIPSAWENMHAYRDYPILGLILLTYNNYPQLTLAGILITAGVTVWNYDKIIEFYRKAKDKANTLFLKINSPKKAIRKKTINEHDCDTDS